jgi:hypothetical protein
MLSSGPCDGGGASGESLPTNDDEEEEEQEGGVSPGSPLISRKLIEYKNNNINGATLSLSLHGLVEN